MSDQEPFVCRLPGEFASKAEMRRLAHIDLLKAKLARYRAMERARSTIDALAQERIEQDIIEKARNV